MMDSKRTGKLIAVTGGMGSGKSTVARILCERGLPVLELDDVILTWYADPSCEVYQAIVGSFGDRVLKDGAIDRDLLRHHMRTEGRRDELAAVEIPALLQTISAFRETHEVGVMVGSRIVDSGLPFDLLILVEALEDIRRSRIETRSSIPKEIVDTILQHQGGWEGHVDWIFSNDGDLEKLTKLVSEWDECWREHISNPNSTLYNARETE